MARHLFLYPSNCIIFSWLFGLSGCLQQKCRVVLSIYSFCLPILNLPSVQTQTISILTSLLVFLTGTDAYLHLSRLGDSQEPLPWWSKYLLIFCSMWSSWHLFIALFAKQTWLLILSSSGRISRLRVLIPSRVMDSATILLSACLFIHGWIPFAI